MSREDNQMLGTPELTVGDVPADKRRRAAQTVTTHAGADADQRAVLLDMLALDPKEARK